MDRWLAVDLGGTRLRAAVVHRELRLLARREEPTRLSEGPDGTFDQIARLATEAAAAAGMTVRDLASGVIGSPGPLDNRTGVVLDAPNLAGWVNVPLGPAVSARLGIPIRVVNDASAAALGEYALGSGRGTRDFVYLTVSTGVGGGIIAGGVLIEGVNGVAGEVGHITVDHHGEPCSCGNVGCVEVYASGSGMARRYARRQRDLGISAPHAISAAEIADRAARGDATAQEIVQDGIAALGAGVTSCLNLFNPEVVALGGGVTNLGAPLFDGVREYVRHHAYALPAATARIVPAELGEDVGLLGAAVLAVGNAES